MQFIMTVFSNLTKRNYSTALWLLSSNSLSIQFEFFESKKQGQLFFLAIFFSLFSIFHQDPQNLDQINMYGSTKPMTSDYISWLIFTLFMYISLSKKFKD